MTSVQTKRDVDCSDFTDEALAWFREGDELADKSYGDHIEYYSETSGLRRAVKMTSIALGSIAVGLLALGWLVG
ncbi:MAG: hypothetical protein MJE77_04565 [Proteobacteria bacterium]|nr:hypothetical protein [Pseudomonadota bacterium]